MRWSFSEKADAPRNAHEDDENHRKGDDPPFPLDDIYIDFLDHLEHPQGLGLVISQKALVHDIQSSLVDNGYPVLLQPGFEALDVLVPDVGAALFEYWFG